VGFVYFAILLFAPHLFLGFGKVFGVFVFCFLSFFFFVAACVRHELLIFMCDTINHQSLSMNLWPAAASGTAYPSIFAFLSMWTGELQRILHVSCSFFCSDPKLEQVVVFPHRNAFVCRFCFRIFADRDFVGGYFVFLTNCWIFASSRSVINEPNSNS